MIQETYQDKLKVQIGRAKASVLIDDYFPLVGNAVKISALTKWTQSGEWQVQSNPGQTLTSEGIILNQTAEKQFNITQDGELIQRFIARNSLSEVTVQKTIYAMQAQSQPYFKVEVSKEVIRTDGETATIKVVPDMGYTGEHTVSARVYRENEEAKPIKTLTFETGQMTGEGKVSNFSFTEPSDRGIYDLEVEVTDTLSGVTFVKRINKIVTVTPRLAPEPIERASGYKDIFAVKAYTTYSGVSKVDFFIRLWENTAPGLHYAELSLPAGEQNGTCWHEDIDISVLPAGTTLVLKKDPNEPDSGYAHRVLLKGNKSADITNENGTPNFTWEKPLIITINQDTVFEVPFKYYSGLNLNGNCRNIVIDGRGYHNLTKGIHIHRHNKDEFAETCMFLLNGTSDVELIELELSEPDFTAIMAKTDPNPNRPWFWYGAWEFKNLFLHHCYIHDTHGEGFYIGYFTPETKKDYNSSGELTTYRAHAMQNTRIYRNYMENMGYDGMQLSNARNAEVCYNTVLNSSWRGDKDQCSGISIQSMSGKCYNNIIRKYNGAGLQIGPLGDLEVFNNICSDCPEGQPGVQFLFSENIPEQNPEGSGIEDKMKIQIHNNVIICNGAAINGRNTVQIRGIYCTDNIIVYKSVKFGNMTADTISKWETQESGNTWIRQGILDFVVIDENKIADSANGNFQISADSPLIQTGIGTHFKFDFRGYKNWFATVAPSGAYLGVYKTVNINDEPLLLMNLSINDGATFTQNNKVNVSLVFTGNATRYKIGETEDLNSVAWLDIPSTGTVEYVLSENFGQKIVYAQIGAGSLASEIKSGTIEYRAIPISLDNFLVNNGIPFSRHLTIPVSFISSGSYQAVKYRLSESSELSSVEWVNIPVGITYTFTNVGEKTLYGQIKDTKGNVSDIKSASVNIQNLARKALVSLGYNNTEIPHTTAGLSVFDLSLGITQFNSQHIATASRIIYDTTGEMFGTAIPSSVSINMQTNPVCKGSITSNNSGIYPDKYLEHNSAVVANTKSTAMITFTIPAGVYKMRLLCNTIWNVRVTPNDALLYKAITDTDNVNFILPQLGVQNNTQYLTEPMTVTVGATGLLSIEFGISGINTTYYYAPLNCIEIEEISSNRERNEIK